MAQKGKKADMSPTAFECEKALGPAPISIKGTLITLDGRVLSYRTIAREWLKAMGVEPAVADRTKDYQLAAAYNDYFLKRGNYLKRMREGEPRQHSSRSHNGFAANIFDASAIDLDDAPDDTPPALGAQDAITSLRDAATSGTSQLDAIIAKAADQVIGQRLAQMRQELQADIRKTIAGTKLELSDEAKRAIGDLARGTADARIAELMPPRQIEVLHANAPSVNVGLQHERFPLLLRALGARDHRGFHLNIWLTGPTGSGKTTAAEAAAKALEPSFSAYTLTACGQWEIRNPQGELAALNGLAHDAPFGADSSLDADYKVVGFKDANGTFHWTTFLRIFAFGGIYVADEIDNWLPSALVALNAALANGWISTPIGIIRRHKDCAIIAAANTWGLGATSEYVGRSKLDAATINRFPTKLDWPVDERLESALAAEMGGADWCHAVQTARARAKTQGLHVIISPRNTFDGIALLRQGFEWADVVSMNLAAGLKPEQVEALGLNALRPAPAQNAMPSAPAAPAADISPIARVAWEQFEKAIRNGERTIAARLFQDYHSVGWVDTSDFVADWLNGLLPQSRETFLAGKAVL